LQKNLLVSERMPTESSSAEDVSSLATEVRAAIELRYGESGAARYGIIEEAFGRYVAAVVVRYGAEFSEGERVALVRSLRVEELMLARACSAGNDAAWGDFLARFRGEMYRAAGQVAKDELTGRELADGLYAELYGLPNQDGRRVSKLNYYMGRGSLAGWLRTVLAQRHVDRCRSQARHVSLDEQLELGVAFAAKAESTGLDPDHRLAEAVSKTLAELDSKERFLLASYYLDRRTLAMIGRQLGVHESTVSRKLEKLAGTIRKRIRKWLLSRGIDARRCAEILQEIDVRDLNINVEQNLRQEKKSETF
jgi:RNA polymerase sigma-70 factor (ECF subfamily)